MSKAIPETILADWKLEMLANELRIAVSGFPGTGKTSLVKALADKYGLPIVEEGMSSIGKAAGGIKRALKQGRKEDLPRLKKCLVQEFLNWDSERFNKYRQHPGFVADRWEADLIDWWLLAFKNETQAPAIDDITKRLFKNFLTKSKLISFAIVTPFQKPYSHNPNEDGNRRMQGFTLHLFNTVTIRGLIQTFTKLPIITLPPGPMTVDERVAIIDREIQQYSKHNRQPAD